MVRKSVLIAACLALSASTAVPVAAADRPGIEMGHIEQIREFEEQHSGPQNSMSLQSNIGEEETTPQFSVDETGINFELAEGTERAKLSTESTPKQRDVQEVDGEQWTLTNDALYRESQDGPAAYSMISGGDDSLTWTLDLPEGITARVDETGGVEFRNDRSGGTLVYDARLEAPWAIDEQGQNVATWYEVADGSIIQKIDRDGVSGEVLVDPKISYGMGVYFNAWGHEMLAYHGALKGGVSTAAVAA